MGLLLQIENYQKNSCALKIPSMLLAERTGALLACGIAFWRPGNSASITPAAQPCSIAPRSQQARALRRIRRVCLPSRALVLPCNPAWEELVLGKMAKLSWISPDCEHPGFSAQDGLEADALDENNSLWRLRNSIFLQNFTQSEVLICQ